MATVTRKLCVVPLQTLEDDDDYYLWDEGGRPCVPAPGARSDQDVQDVLCVPDWQQDDVPVNSKEGKHLTLPECDMCCVFLTGSKELNF